MRKNNNNYEDFLKNMTFQQIVFTTILLRFKAGNVVKNKLLKGG